MEHALPSLFDVVFDKKKTVMRKYNYLKDGESKKLNANEMQQNKANFTCITQEFIGNVA
jgi:hypothetical protein